MYLNCVINEEPKIHEMVIHVLGLSVLLPIDPCNQFFSRTALKIDTSWSITMMHHRQ